MQRLIRLVPRRKLFALALVGAAQLSGQSQWTGASPGQHLLQRRQCRHWDSYAWVSVNCLRKCANGGRLLPLVCEFLY